MSIATARNFDFNLKDLVPLSSLMAEMGRSDETGRRHWKNGLKTVKWGRHRYTTHQWMREYILAQSGIDPATVPTAETSRARAAELARVDRELDAAGIK